MNVVIHSRETLVFRDGRPFGDPGHVNGGMLCWPWPSTITGMLRSRIGLSRDREMFQTRNGQLVARKKVEELNRITARRVIPVWQPGGAENEWQYLFPAPADALVHRAAGQDNFSVDGYNYENPFEQGGINLPWRNWKVPVTTVSEKPAFDSPDLWYGDHFFTWLEKGELKEDVAARDLGMSFPVPEVRMHTAIDPATGVVRTGQLFASQGINLTTPDSEQSKAGRMGIGVELTGTEEGDNPHGPCYFGAERKTAFVDTLTTSFPPCRDWFENRKFLRLILISPGDFGSWAPSWLLPDKRKNETCWRVVPGTDISVRLASALVPRWQPVSGWDYLKGEPKKTRKLVPAGAVYVIEVKDSSRSQELARLMWGRSMADGLSDPDGCGAVCVGNIHF